MDRGGPRPRGPARLLRLLPGGRGGAVLLRTLPRSLRSRPAQATRRLVHAHRSRPLHGCPRRQGPEGRPRHPGRLGGGKCLRARPVLRNRRVSGRSAAPHRRQPRRAGPRRPHRRPGETGRHGTGVRLRDHAGALRRRPSASRLGPAGPRRAAGGRRSFDELRRTRRRVPHQRAHRLGAESDEAAAVPGVGGRTRPGGARQTGNADPRHPRQPALQRFCRHGGGRRARTVASLPFNEARTPPRRAGAERSLRPLLPYGGTPYRREDGPRRGVLHLQLLVARRAVVHGDAGALSGGVRRHPHRLPERRQIQDRQGGAGRLAGPEHFLDGRRPGRHSGRHRHCDTGAQGRPCAR